MRRRRRHQEPDTRLNWRDPNMPVLRVVECGFRTTVEEFPPDEEKQHAEYMLQVQMENTKTPRWIDDPSYNWRQPGTRRRQL